MRKDKMNEVMKVQNEISNKSQIAVITKPEDMVIRFFAYLDTSEQTVRTYKYGVQQFMKYLAEQGITQPTRDTILSYKKSLLEKGLKPSTVALYLSSIRRLFAWADSEGLYANITSGVKSPKQQGGHKRDYLSGSQIRAMLSQAQTKRDYAMMLLISTCGLRTIEVVRANVGDMHNVGGIWVLDIQGKGHSDKDAYVKLSEPVYEAIREYLTERGQVSETEPLFVSESRRNKGQRLTTRTVSQVCKNAMKSAGYDTPRLTAHSLRHSAATLALLSGVELSDVQQYMRHTSINITMIYNHAVNRMKSLCENAVTNAIFGKCA